MREPFVIGRPLPRAEQAYVEPAKWSWILASHGHGREWAKVFRIGPHDASALWTAIATEVRAAPVTKIRRPRGGGVGCSVPIYLTLDERSARVTTAWHYTRGTSTPRLVTAYPTL